MKFLKIGFVLVITIQNLISFGQTDPKFLVKSDTPLTVSLKPNFEFQSDSLFLSESDNDNFEKLLMNGKNKEAIALIENTELLIPNNYLAIATKGVLYLNNNQFELSYKAFKSCIEMVEDSIQKSSFYHILSVFDASNHATEKSIENLTKSFEFDPKNFEKAIILGELSLKINNTEQAVFFFRKSID